MTVLITLTTAGIDSGPFDLYSNLDGFTIPFETGVTNSALMLGYSSALVPDYTNIIRLKSTGVCINYTDITLFGITTTTTSSTTGIPAPICPDQVLAVQVCNSNAAKDDNFDVYINNIYVGHLDLSLNAQVGSIILATTDPVLHVTSADFACPIVGMVEYKFNPSILVYGINIIEMRNVQINFNGNYGSVGIRSYQILGTDLVNPCILADLTYSGVDGASFTFEFMYTECCVPPTTTTTTTVAVPTTTTTTTPIPTTTTTTTVEPTTTTTTIAPTYATWDISSLSNALPANACSAVLDSVAYSDPISLASVTMLYNTSALTTPFVGDGNYWHIREGAFTYSIVIGPGGDASGLAVC